MAGKTIGLQSDDHMSCLDDRLDGCLDGRLESPKVKWLGNPSENSQNLQLKLSRKKCIRKRQSLVSEPAT